jgi:hypothetical protein
VAVAALAPIAPNHHTTDMYQAISRVKSLPARNVELPKQFAVGYNAPAEYVLGAIVMLLLSGLVIAAAWPRDGRPTRATALLGLIAAVWVLPLIALIGGFDVVLTRNDVLLIPPLAALAALGAWRIARRAIVVLAVVAVVQVGVIVSVALTPIYQREDWRGLMSVIDDGQPTPQAIFMRGYQGPAATYYSPTLQPQAAPGQLVVRSVAVADRSEGGVALKRVPVPPTPAGFRLVRSEQNAQYRVFVWRAPVPTPVPPQAVQAFQLPQPPPPWLTIPRPSRAGRRPADAAQSSAWPMSSLRRRRCCTSTKTTAAATITIALGITQPGVPSPLPETSVIVAPWSA